MNDERAVEVMAKGIASDRAEYPVDSATFDDARAALAALRAEGFDLYRPDECAPVYTASAMSQSFVRCDRNDAEYLLVQVGGEG